MNVGAIMSSHVVTVGMDDTLRRVRDMFASSKFHHLVVVDRGAVVGVISDRDVLKCVSPFVGKYAERTMDRDSLKRRVHQIMTRRLVFVDEGTSILEAGHLMLDARVSCLPVIDPTGGCIGIVTMRDLLNWALVECAGGDKACPLPDAA